MYAGWAFVDVDGTLIDANDNPRPFIRELFYGLKHENLILVVWSGGGRVYAENQVRKLGEEIYNLVDEFRWKGTPVAWNHIRPVFFIDDSEFIEEEHNVAKEAVFRVPFYNKDTAVNDEWLLRALHSAQTFYEYQGKEK